MSSMTEIPSTTQQFGMSNALQVDPQQMQQMAAMMSMAAAAGMAGNNGMMMGGVADTGVPAMPPPPMAAPSVPDASTALAAAAAQQLGGVDPSMAQAYAQMFTYLQQAQQAASASAFAAPPTLPNYGCSSGTPAPAISVSVEGMKFQYQLTEDDLQKVFSRYGAVREIRVDEAGTLGQITFDDFSYAQAAMNDLNGKVLNGLEGTLRISWASSAGAAVPPYSVMPPFSAGWGLSGAAPFPAAAAFPASTGFHGVLGGCGDVTGAIPAMPSAPAPPGTPPRSGTGGGAIGSPNDSRAPAHVKGVRKYTCRFLIGIENDKDFQVVRRIIGAKGSNMKRIVKQSEAKLRLRGVGSGYFEGAGQKESNEPLQLCVSCTTPDGYRTAVSLVEELMESVYSEYRIFCRENGRPEPDLHATPQLVSSGRERGGGGMGDIFSPDGGIGELSFDGSSPSPGLLGDGDDDDDDFSPGADSRKREGGRRRGRRSRGKKSEAGKVEKGEPPRNAPDVEEIHSMIDQRNEARRQCNFAEADRIRNSLHERGVALMDEPGGRGKASEVTTWRYWRD